MPQGGARQPGLLARSFCFAPQAGARVGVQPGSSKAERAKRQREQAASQAALPAQPTGAPAVAELPSTPSSAAALAAYLGSALAPAPSCFGSTDTSLALTSSPCDTSSLGSTGPSGGDSGAASAGKGHARSSLDEGYDADSDCPPSEEFTPRRFRCALRHTPVETDGPAVAAASAGATEQEGEEAEFHDAVPVLNGPALADTVNSFDQQSPGSSRSRGSDHGAHAVPGRAATQAADAAEPEGRWVAAAPRQSPHADSQPPSSRASRLSFAASGSISPYHFLGGASRRSTRSVRSLGSRRPAATTSAAEPEAAASLADEAGDVAVVAESSPLALPLPRKASVRVAQAPPGAPGTVVRRLSEIQGGHYTSLEKLRQQCGSFEGEGRAGAGCRAL